MKIKLFSVFILSFILFFSCESKVDNKSISTTDVVGVTERSPEEIENFKKYAPEFTFESIDGKKVNLKDFKGKYVYVDVWATWCRPCLEQLPAMKEMEEKYRDTDIEFLSISVDKERDKEKWQRMVKNQDMKGVQLYAGGSSTFHRDYQIKTIPRFLLIGKDGELLNDNAPRPMDYRTRGLNGELVEIFDQLLNY
ncbi:MAG: TlpA disulfide reductase family protein [Weeksellaceae bacterium]|jgi:thiol-disulfide isomerase/thioredoxin|nr:TlpA disulfide reductase family protein [Weeksellaceae bacterium]